jgi:type II secretory pathway pseudopilin PulG
MKRKQPYSYGLDNNSGFVLMGLLVVLALAGLALMTAVDVWTMHLQREREKQLLFAGNAYRRAIQSYYFGAPNGQPRTLPASLTALLEDDRYPVVVRHLRRLYPDPITGSADWGEFRVAGRIAGVYSQSDALPIKQSGFGPDDQGFNDKAHYLDWIFAYSAEPLLGGNPSGAIASNLAWRPASSSQPAMGSIK